MGGDRWKVGKEGDEGEWSEYSIATMGRKVRIGKRWKWGVRT